MSVIGAPVWTKASANSPGSADHRYARSAAGLGVCGKRRLRFRFEADAIAAFLTDPAIELDEKQQSQAAFA
jgi:hypothetical protein